MIKHIVSGVLASLLVAGAAVGVTAAPASASGPEKMVLKADVDAWQVTLQDGRKVGDQYGDFLINAGSVGETFTKDVFALRGKPDGQVLSGAAEYQIVMLGEPTGYWIKARMFASGPYRAQCDIFSGAPSAGGTLADPSPFTCSTTMHVTSPTEIRFTFNLGLNRDAEASGAISPTDAVSLNNGTYKTYGLPYAKHGEESVASGGTTSFDTVLREGDQLRQKDKPAFEKQARTEFAYQIHDKGVPTDYWVAGVSTNHRGSVFTGDGRCGIYDSNPLAKHGELDKSSPRQGTGYTCTADGSYKGGAHEDGRVHYFTQFTVAPAKAVVIHADFDPWRVALQDGRAVADSQDTPSVSAKSVPETFTKDAFTVAAFVGGKLPSGAAEYQIVMLGKATGYWVKAWMFHRGMFQAQCDVYFGAPSAGGKLADTSPFRCSPKLGETTAREARITFSVGLNRDAEASGAISPTGGVSLKNGTYKTYELPYAKHGEESVASGGTTSFDTVLREGDQLRQKDKPAFEKQARTEFAYRIYENGKPTDYWVAGMSTNYRGWVFKGDSRCGIFQSNPLAGEGQFDQRVPLRASPYTCTADGDYKHGPHEDGNGHYFAQFTVSAKK